MKKLLLALTVFLIFSCTSNREFVDYQRHKVGDLEYVSYESDIFGNPVIHYERMNIPELMEHHKYDIVVEKHGDLKSLNREEKCHVCESCFRTGDYSKTVEITSILIDSRLKDKYVPLYYRASSYRMMGEYGKSIVDYKSALEKKPDSPEALSGIVKSYIALNQTKNAVTYGSKLLELYKSGNEFSQVYLQVIPEIYFKSNITDESLKYLIPELSGKTNEEMRELISETPEVYNRLQLMSYGFKKYGMIEKLLSDNDFERAQFLSGKMKTVYEEMGQKQYIKQELKRILKEDADNCYNYSIVLQGYNMINSHEQADSVFTILHKAYKKGKLKKIINQDTLAIVYDRFKIKPGYTVKILRKMDPPKKSRDIIYIAHLLDKYGDVVRTVHTEQNSKYKKGSPKHLLCENKGYTNFILKDKWEEEVDYATFKAAVIKEFENEGMAE